MLNNKNNKKVRRKRTKYHACIGIEMKEIDKSDVIRFSTYLNCKNNARYSFRFSIPITRIGNKTAKISDMNQKMPVLLLMAISLSSLSLTLAFSPPTGMMKSKIHNSFTKSTSLQRKQTSSTWSMSSVDEDGDYLSSFFTGGAFESKVTKELNDRDAIEIASKIRSVKDLGWNKPPKRKGNKRPRHRAWGGQDEVPVQDKPAYDENNKNSPEKWLSQVWI